MPRTIVSKETLLEWMNSRLREHKECANCHYATITLLAERDADGCNWSPSWLQCSGKPIAECRPIANQVAEEARKLFDLQEV